MLKAIVGVMPLWDEEKDSFWINNFGANELKELHKPFVIVLNSNAPYSDYTQNLAMELEKKYSAPVIPMNCTNLNMDDINNIFGRILFEFPIDQISINYPKWVDSLDNTHWLKQSLLNNIKSSFNDITVLKEIDTSLDSLQNTDVIKKSLIDNINLGTGEINVSIDLKDDLFYKILSEMSSIDITNEGDLFNIISELSYTKKEYDKISSALYDVRTKGYGIVTPTMEELILEEPEIVKQGSKFGVRLKAKAPSIHLIRADIQTEVSPIVGSEKQSEELVNYLLSEFENDPIKIWESNIFGKNLHELVNEGLQNKLYKMPDDARGKLQETLERIINEGSGGLICIIL